MIDKRHLLALGFGIAATAVLPSLASSQNFPTKPIKIIVSAAPGGSPDILARIIGQAVSTRVGQPVVIENKPGGAGNIAADLVAKSTPDGHTIFVASDSLSINQTLFRNLPFDAVKSFAPIVQAISSPQVFAVEADVPARSVQEFVAAAKAAPAKYSLASPAIGTTGQLGVLMLQNQANIKLTPVVYRSAQPALTDVLGKHAHGIIVTLAPALPHIKSGKLRALGVSTAARSPSLPDVPTFVEQGLPDFNFDSWQGFVAPAGTPAPVIERLNKEINAVIADPAVRALLVEQAFDPVGGSAADFGKLIAASVGSWGKVIAANDIKPVD